METKRCFNNLSLNKILADRQAFNIASSILLESVGLYAKKSLYDSGTIK